MSSTGTLGGWCGGRRGPRLDSTYGFGNALNLGLGQGRLDLGLGLDNEIVLAELIFVFLPSRFYNVSEHGI